MKPIRALIVDDEELCRKGVRLLLEEDTEFIIQGECANGQEAIKEIKENKPDVVFLDIRMPEISGFDVLKSIKPEMCPKIVFVTAYDDYAVKAFEVHALDYILKPFSKIRFKKTLTNVKKAMRDRDASTFARSLMHLISSIESMPENGDSFVSHASPVFLDRILVQERGGHEVVWTRDIEWIQGADYYVHLHCRSKSYLYRERLKNLETKLSPEVFIRIHRSSIINLNYMERIIADYKKQVYALMKSGTKVKISRKRKKDFFNLCQKKYGLKT